MEVLQMSSPATAGEIRPHLAFAWRQRGRCRCREPRCTCGRSRCRCRRCRRRQCICEERLFLADGPGTLAQRGEEALYLFQPERCFPLQLVGQAPRLEIVPGQEPRLLAVSWGDLTFVPWSCHPEMAAEQLARLAGELWQRAVEQFRVLP